MFKYQYASHFYKTKHKFIKRLINFKIKLQNYKGMKKVI